MSFEPASPISIITCDHCQGQGCSACYQQGVYALEDHQPIVFNLPDFVDFHARQQSKIIFFIKHSLLIILALAIIIAAWFFLN